MFFQCGITILHFHQQCTMIPISISLSTLVSVCLFDHRHLSEYEMVSHCVFVILSFKVEVDSLVLDFKLNLGSMKIYHTVSNTITDLPPRVEETFHSLDSSVSSHLSNSLLSDWSWKGKMNEYSRGIFFIIFLFKEGREDRERQRYDITYECAVNM